MKKSRGTPFRNSYYVKAHQYARQGMSRTEIADALGVPYDAFKRWCTEDRDFQNAVDSGRGKDALSQRPGHQSPDAGQTWQEYTWERLDPELQEVWQRIEALEAETNEDKENRKRNLTPGSSAYRRRYDKLERLFHTSGIKDARKSLYVHALVASRFNANEACRKVGVSRQAVRKWFSEEPDYKNLVDTIREFKANFCEAAFYRLVAAGEPSAILHGVKSLCVDRGLGPTQKNVAHTHTGEVDLMHKKHSSSEVIKNMTFEEKKALLEAARRQRDVIESAPEMLPAKKEG